jgi:2-dehydropantoate 2-reductase
LFPANTIISGVVYLPVTQFKPGYITMEPLELFEIGLYPSPSQASTSNGASTTVTNGAVDSGYHSPSEAQAQLQCFADLFAKAGATCKIFTDIQAPRWIKLSVNAAWNPVCALTRCDDANYLRSSGIPSSMSWPPSPTAFNSLAEVYAVMKEIAALAEAAGYPGVVTEEAIRTQLERPTKRLREGGKEPSMLTDVRFNRGMEVDAILGNAVKIAEKVGFGDQVPRLRLLCALARGLNYSIVPDERWRAIG